jgi:GAF domain-containing protein
MNRGQAALLGSSAAVALAAAASAIAGASAVAGAIAVVAVIAAGGAAIWTVRGRARLQRELERVSFLAEATTLLSSSLDYDLTVQNASTLAVPELADWCVLDLIEPEGTIRRRAVAHSEPGLEESSWRLERGYEDAGQLGPGEVARSARTALWREVPDELLAALARDEQHLERLRRLGAQAAVIVPLRTVDRVLGVMTLGSRSAGRFSDGEVELVQELARRVALAIANADEHRGATTKAARRFEREGNL